MDSQRTHVTKLQPLLFSFEFNLFQVFETPTDDYANILQSLHLNCRHVFQEIENCQLYEKSVRFKQLAPHA